MKRYNLEADCTVEPMNGSMHPNDDGDWVSYDDATTEINRLKQELEEAKQSKLKIGTELDKWRNRAIAHRSTLNDLQRQLAEARAEVERYKQMLDDEIMEHKQEIAEARQEAARKELGG